MALLEVDNLSIGYQTRAGFSLAVEGVSFSLDRAGSLGFVGESGCGKTTIGMSLMGLLPANAAVRQGRILFEGRNLLEIKAEEMRQIRWKRISMIFQAAMNALNPVHRVNEQIAEAILAHDAGLSKREAMDQVEELFRLVDIPESRMTDFPHQYSGGMKQRAIIAMALSCLPAVIIADEPTTALDVIVQDQILKELKKIQKELGIAVLFISHDIAVVANVCRTVGVMFAGRIVEYGAREKVFGHPYHPYTRALLSSYLTLEGAAARKRLNYEETSFRLGDSLVGCRYCHRCSRADRSCSVESPRWMEIAPDHRVLCHRCQ